MKSLENVCTTSSFLTFGLIPHFKSEHCLVEVTNKDSLGVNFGQFLCYRFGNIPRGQLFKLFSCPISSSFLQLLTLMPLFAFLSAFRSDEVNCQGM